MNRYEDFKAWQLARALNVKVFEMTSKPPSVHDFRFRNNIRDAADSAERNFPEGFGKFSPTEFAHFLDHSRASLLETKNELSVGFGRGYFSEQDTAEATALATRALGALSGLQRYLRSPRARENARKARERHLRKEKHSEPTNPRTDEPRTDEPPN